MNNTRKTFRQWVDEIWRDNCEEHLVYNEAAYTQQEYFQKYKYWLKREYKYRVDHDRI